VWGAKSGQYCVIGSGSLQGGEHFKNFDII